MCSHFLRTIKFNLCKEKVCFFGNKKLASQFVSSSGNYRSITCDMRSHIFLTWVLLKQYFVLFISIYITWFSFWPFNIFLPFASLVSLPFSECEIYVVWDISDELDYLDNWTNALVLENTNAEAPKRMQKPQQKFTVKCQLLLVFLLEETVQVRKILISS